MQYILGKKPTFKWSFQTGLRVPSNKTKTGSLTGSSGELNYPTGSSYTLPTKSRKTHCQESSSYTFAASGLRRNSWTQQRQHQADNRSHTGTQTIRSHKTSTANHITSRSDTEKPPFKGFPPGHQRHPDCIYHVDTRNLYNNWAANAIYNEEGNLLKCVFDDAEGTVKMLIREDLFQTIEHGLRAAWKKVASRPSDDDFANRKGKGKGGKKGNASVERGVDDYLYKVLLVKVPPNHREEDDETLQGLSGCPSIPWRHGLRYQKDTLTFSKPWNHGLRCQPDTKKSISSEKLDRIHRVGYSFTAGIPSSGGPGQR